MDCKIKIAKLTCVKGIPHLCASCVDVRRKQAKRAKSEAMRGRALGRSAESETQQVPSVPYLVKFVNKF